MYKKATKTESKLRLAIFGPSGSGKTYSALRIAAGMGGKVALIDSERKSASKYADKFDFDTVDLEVKTIEEYVKWISAGSEYDILIIDSLSHGWQELLVEIDNLTKTKYSGNSWAAWSDGTPKQRSLVDAILSFPGHIIATMRSKTEWSVETEGGKMRPKRVGLAPEQGKGIEYEFDLLIELSSEHFASVIKDRTGKFQDKIIEKIGEDFGKQLAGWLQEGEPLASYKEIQLLRELASTVKSKLQMDDAKVLAKIITSGSCTKTELEEWKKKISELKEK